VADRPDGNGLLGSCWTKVDRTSEPVLGEIYVISVDPDLHSQGWGRSLTVAGLQWMANRGVSVGMLYTTASNTAAVTLYESSASPSTMSTGRTCSRGAAASPARSRSRGPPRRSRGRRRPSMTSLAQRRAQDRPMGEDGQHHADHDGGEGTEERRGHDGPVPLGDEPRHERMNAPSPKVKKEDNAACTGEPR